MMGRYRDDIRKNISYGYFFNDSGYCREELDELVELIVDVMMMPDNAFLRIAGAEKPVEVVKEHFLKLGQNSFLGMSHGMSGWYLRGKTGWSITGK